MRSNYYEGSTCPNCSLSQPFSHFYMENAKKEKAKYLKKFNLIKVHSSQGTFFQSTCCGSDWFCDLNEICYLVTPARSKLIENFFSEEGVIKSQELLNELKELSQPAVYPDGSHYTAGVVLNSGEKSYARIFLSNSPLVDLEKDLSNVYTAMDVKSLFFDKQIIPHNLRSLLYNRPEVAMSSYIPLALKSRSNNSVFLLSAFSDVVDNSMQLHWEDLEVFEPTDFHGNEVPRLKCIDIRIPSSMI